MPSLCYVCHLCLFPCVQCLILPFSVQKTLPFFYLSCKKKKVTLRQKCSSSFFLPPFFMNKENKREKPTETEALSGNIGNNREKNLPEWIYMVLSAYLSVTAAWEVALELYPASSVKVMLQVQGILVLSKIVPGR